MESMEARLSTTDIGFPFGSLPDTDQARDWLMELDFVDIWEGSIEEIEELARTAPTREAAAWLYSHIHTRKMMRTFADWPPVRAVQVQPEGEESEERLAPRKSVAPSL